MVREPGSGLPLSLAAVVGSVSAGMLPGAMAGFPFVAVKAKVPEPVLRQVPLTPSGLPPAVYCTTWPMLVAAATPGVPLLGGASGAVGATTGVLVRVRAITVRVAGRWVAVGVRAVIVWVAGKSVGVGVR